MNTQQSPRILKNFTLVAFFILILGGIFFTFTRSTIASETQNNTAVTASVGSSFTYQGELNDSGNPVNDTCNMVFRLYENNTQVGGNLNKNNVTVNDGIFSIELDFGNDAFTGGPRALQIDVKCGSDSGYTTLTPNVTLNAAPYALSLRPGAIISGSTGTMLTGWSESDSTAAIGLYGYGKSSGFAAYGVKGETPQAAGTGVLGVGPNSGVEGIASATNGSGTGVDGQNFSTNGIGVQGWARASSGSTIGTKGHAISPNGTGVYGFASATSGTNYGLYGETYSANGYGIYSEGNAHINGDLTWKPIIGYVTLPAAAFHPINDSYTFVNNGSSLAPSDASDSFYLAEVQLPHNAVVTKLTYYWKDSDGSNNTAATLYKISLDGNEVSMASVPSNGSAGTADSSFVNSISSATVDNSASGYYVWLSFPNTNFAAYGVTIEYTINQPY